MKKIRRILTLLYYPAALLPCLALFGLGSLLLSGDGGDLGAAIAMTYLLVFILLPALAILLPRFSLLPRIVDPFAAVEIPLFLYGMMLFGRANRTGSLLASIRLVNRDLLDDHGSGCLFLIGLFLLGLIASVSPARRRGESISFRILNKITKKQIPPS